MKPQFEIKDNHLITAILEKVEYGTLALCKDNCPYSVPINYVYQNGAFYFHGAKKGKKMEFIEANAYASLSVVEPFSLIPSYFSSNENLACPASHFFRSISVEGAIEIVSDYDEKVTALQALMEKLQPQGKYKHLSDEAYQKMIDATAVFKLIPSEIRGKIKLGQHLPKERFEMIIEHLKERGSELDKQTINEMLRQMKVGV